MQHLLSEQKQTKKQVLHRRFKEAHILAMFNKGQNERKKRTSTKQKHKPGRKCCSIVSKMQGGSRFVQ